MVIPTETCIILNPNENEPKYADSAVAFEAYGERSPPSRPNADYERPGDRRQFSQGQERRGIYTGVARLI